MVRIPVRALCCALALGAISPAFAQTSRNPVTLTVPAPSYAVLTGQVLGAQLVIDAQVRTAARLKAEEAPGLAPGRVRFLIEADVRALIRGTAAVPARISWLADVPLDARGKAPKLKKQRVLIFARVLPGKPASVQLTGIDSQYLWSAELDQRIRAVSREIIATNAPPAVTGLGEAFHVPGTLPGEGETQIFIQLSNGGQASLQILRRPGQRPRWAVALGDFIDESASVPAKDTLLWYRLACGLPRTIPADSLDSSEPANARIARDDYQLVLRELGPCA